MLLVQHGVVWGHKGTHRLWLKYFRLLVLGVFVFTPSYAAPPIPFGSWSNQGGTIRATCPAGFTCTENVASENMLQRFITNNSTGETYIQNIIEDNTQGTHRSEAFVNATNDAGLAIPNVDPDDPTITPGITPPDIIPDNNDQITENNMVTRNTGASARTEISQAGVNATTFDYDYTVNSGWAIVPGEPSVDINFQVTDTMAQGVSIDYSFFLTQRSDANGNITGRLYGIDQMVQNSAVLGPGNGGGQDDHMFVLRRASGDYVTAGSATLPPPAGGMGGMGMGGGTAPNPANGAGAPPFGIVPNPQPTPFPNPPGAPTGNPMGMGGGNAPPGGSVAWNTGAEVQVIWIGQMCPGCMIAGMGGMGMGGSGAFSFQQYENISTGASAATRSILGTAPFTWTNPPFGPRPPGL